jgi:hypothetical protein
MLMATQLVAGGALTTFYEAVWNPNTGNLQFYQAYNTEVANGTDLSAYKFRLLVIGQR